MFDVRKTIFYENMGLCLYILWLYALDIRPWSLTWLMRLELGTWFTNTCWLHIKKYSATFLKLSKLFKDLLLFFWKAYLNCMVSFDKDSLSFDRLKFNINKKFQHIVLPRQNTFFIMPSNFSCGYPHLLDPPFGSYLDESNFIFMRGL